MFHIRTLVRILLSLTLLVPNFNTQVHAQTKFDTYHVTLLTYSPGNELYSSFGHSSLRVKDTSGETDWIYNYGTFDFDDPAFYFGFIRGNLLYRLSRLPFPYVLEELNSSGRALVETPLNLNLEERTRLIQFLEINYLPENREYLYDFLLNNCATKLIELIDFATQNRTVYNPAVIPELTFRELLDPYFENRPWLDIGIDLAMGLPADRKVVGTEAGFLPDDLHLLVKNARVASLNGKNIMLAGTDRLLVQAGESNKKTVLQASWILLPLVLLCLISTIFGSYFSGLFNYLYNIVLYTSAFVGFIILCLWLFTNHYIFGFNPDLLWANPLLITLLLFRKKATSVKKLKFRSFLLVTIATMAALGTILSFVIERNINLAAIACILLMGIIEKLRTTKQYLPASVF